MVDIPVTDKSIVYVAAGGEQVLDVDWVVDSIADLTVTRSRAGISGVLVYNTDYIITGIGDPRGARVVLITPALVGDGYSISGDLNVELVGVTNKSYVLARWLGPWTIGTSYKNGDAVAHNGSSWLLVFAHIAAADNEPGTGIKWQVYWVEVAANGDQGPQGVQGIAGPAGADGLDGAQGIQGIAGPAGTDGLDGAQGVQGVAGPAGVDGLDGAQGIQGIQGIQGPVGPQGNDGANAVPNEFGVGAPINTDYSAAKGPDLFTNGTGLLGNNYNLPASYAFDPVVTPNLPGAFRLDGHYPGGAFSTEFLAVDPNIVYRLSAYLRQEGLAGDYTAFANGERHQQFMGVTCYDIDKKPIIPQMHRRMKDGGVDSLTTLAAPLTPGDTAITVTDAMGWNNTDASINRRGIAIYEYKNSFGAKYTDYSRLFVQQMFDVGGVNKTTGVITLNQPFPNALANPDDPNGIWPVGSKIANCANGATYKYTFFAGLIVPAVDTWYKTTNFMGGIDGSAGNNGVNFAPGTAFVKLMWLPNYSNRAGGYLIFPDTGGTHSVWFAGISVAPERSAVLVTEATGAKTPHVARANLSTNIMDVVPGALTVEQV